MFILALLHFILALKLSDFLMEEQEGLAEDGIISVWNFGLSALGQDGSIGQLLKISEALIIGDVIGFVRKFGLRLSSTIVSSLVLFEPLEEVFHNHRGNRR